MFSIIIGLLIFSGMNIQSILNDINTLYKQCQPLDLYDKKTLISLINNINNNEYTTTNFDKMLFEELLNFLAISYYMGESAMSSVPSELKINGKNNIKRISFTRYKNSILIRYFEHKNLNLFITIRGTKTIEELFLDSLIMQKTHKTFSNKNAKCHFGFLKIYDNILLRR